jgi:hypothetical protein
MVGSLAGKSSATSAESSDSASFKTTSAIAQTVVSISRMRSSSYGERLRFRDSLANCFQRFTSTPLTLQPTNFYSLDDKQAKQRTVAGRVLSAPLLLKIRPHRPYPNRPRARFSARTNRQ